MSPDKLEKYILDHREQFDDQEPDPGVWDRIDTRKSPVIRINWKSIAWKAAAAAAIFVASYFFHDYMATRNQSSKRLMGENAGDTTPIVNELIEAEAYYSSRINLKKEEVFRLTASNPEVRSEVNKEMVDLDRVFSELKQDLKDNADNEEVIEAMLQNYRLKLDILEEMLLQLKQSNESQNEKDHGKAPIEL
jgi:hypothetical protein